MSERIKFENHLAARVMEIHFPNGYRLSDEASLKELKDAWMDNLKRWHSPYTCLFDARDFTLEKSLTPAFERLIRHFQGFFMRKILGFCREGEEGPKLPFEVISGYDEAVKQTGLARGAGLKRDLSDLRSRIQVDNDFNAHVMEVSFLADTHLATAEDVAILKAKLQNILMMWHTPYSVLLNCVNLTLSEEAKIAFASLERFLRGFFCRDIVGYAPRGDKESYPFKVYRSRHLAAGSLEHQGLAAGDSANCASRKKGS